MLIKSPSDLTGAVGDSSAAPRRTIRGKLYGVLCAGMH